jgi:dTDP-glucose 4,6-dehydratase
MENMSCILITGGAGFIGSHLLRHWLQKYPSCKVLNLDALTYAGNLANLQDVQNAPNYHFIKGDICDYDFVQEVFAQHPIEAVLHLAAESHVDRSITDPFRFAQTNVMGTLSLLQAAKTAGVKRFYHISTDEVYGSLGKDGAFCETTPYDPHSPYSASKAASDHFVRAYGDTYGLPVLVSHCSNNYGPYQFPEKLIPLMVNNICHNKPLPIYGRGENVRDWLYVEDHVEAIDLILHQGRSGETYDIGGDNEWKNIDLVQLLIKITDEQLGRTPGSSERLITFVTDRAGHDLRYAIDAGKLKRELGWKPAHPFEERIRQTVAWYLAHKEWLEQVTSGAYMEYYAQMYGKR